MKNFQKEFDLVRSLVNPISANKRYKHTIKELKEGDFFTLDRLTYCVEEIYTYEERSKKGKVTWSWQEMKVFCIEKGESYYLEYEEDDKLEVYFSDEKIKLRELGVKIEIIKEYADEEEGYITYRGKKYIYEDDYKAYFIKKGEEGILCKFYEFESEDGESLAVEEWPDESGTDYEVYLSHEVNANDISVITLH